MSSAFLLLQVNVEEIPGGLALDGCRTTYGLVRVCILEAVHTLP